MNFKMEYNFLDITNSPTIERYFEKRASEGWLINRIFLGSIFIFKKIEPTALDFSISPYEVEPLYTRKSKSELAEFQEVSKKVGWHYVTESYDSHIYYKTKGAKAIPIQPDEEEEYKTLKQIATKRIRDNWYQIFIFLIFGWFNIGGVTTSVDFLKDGANQLIIPILIIGLTIAIWYIIHMKKFIKVNSKNIEAGQSIEYSNSSFLVPKMTFFLGGFFILLMILYFLYLAMFLRNEMSLVFFVILFVALTFAAVHRLFIKPSRISLKQKKFSWFALLILSFLVGTWIGLFDILSNRTASQDKLSQGEFKVLASADFPEDDFVEGELMFRNISLLVPESYDYYYVNEKEEFVETEYGKALNKSVAKNLTERYLKEKQKEYERWYSEDIEQYFEEGIFNEFLLDVGLEESDLNELKSLPSEDAKTAAMDKIKNRSISSAEETLWNADEVYFLSYKKDEILIRSGKEVFYLSDKDFTDPTIIKQAKEALELN